MAPPPKARIDTPTLIVPVERGAWDANEPSYGKEQEAGVEGHFDFWVANVHDKPAQIQLINTSCKCAEVKLGTFDVGSTMKFLKELTPSVHQVSDLATADRALAAVRDGGRVAYPNGVMPEPHARPGVRLSSYDVIPGREATDKLNRLIDSGPFEIHVARTFPLDQAAEAHRARPGEPAVYRVTGAVGDQALLSRDVRLGDTDRGVLGFEAQSIGVAELCGRPALLDQRADAIVGDLRELLACLVLPKRRLRLGKRCLRLRDLVIELGSGELGKDVARLHTAADIDVALENVAIGARENIRRLERRRGRGQTDGDLAVAGAHRGDANLGHEVQYLLRGGRHRTVRLVMTPAPNRQAT